jgi:hypothetical protein
VSELQALTLAAPEVEGPAAIEMRFTARNGLTVSNTKSFYALDPGKAVVADGAIALFDSSGPLGRHLERASAFAEPFGPGTNLPVLVDPEAPMEPDRLDELTRWVRDGGTAVILGLPSDDHLRPIHGRSGGWRLLPAGGILPFDLTLVTGKGTWVPCSHVVRPHPAFDGLPAGCLMGQEYRDVVPRWSIVEPRTDWIAGNITYGWYQNQKHKQNFTGVESAVHGADLTEIAHGSGRFIVTTCRIVRSLGHDPLADRLLANLVRWVCAK